MLGQCSKLHMCELSAPGYGIKKYFILIYVYLSFW